MNEPKRPPERREPSEAEMRKVAQEREHSRQFRAYLEVNPKPFRDAPTRLRVR